MWEQDNWCGQRGWEIHGPSAGSIPAPGTYFEKEKVKVYAPVALNRVL